MAALAVSGVAGWTVSDVEINRPGASYTFDTLTALGEHGTAVGAADQRSVLFFILGADAFAEIATWSRYPAVLDLAHFVVIARTGTSLASLRSELPDLAPRMSDSPGSIDPQKPSILLVETETPQVSSTTIRRRVARSEPLDGLVPESVDLYIRTHHLYRPESSPAPPSPSPPGRTA
jgi:nicotinate-nucleotide adenylyltransferase